MEIYGYKRSYLNTVLTWIVILASGFLLRLIFYWKPQWMLYCTFYRVPLADAEKVLLIDKYNQYFVEHVNYLSGAPHPSTLIHRGSFHQPDEDEVLKSSDESDGSKYGKRTYGSFVTRQDSTDSSANRTQRRRRTLSARSTKSNLTDNDSDVDLEDDDDDLLEGDNQNSTQKSDLFGGAELAVSFDVHNPVVVQFSSELDKDNHSTHKVRYFENKKIRYIWDEDDGNFVRLRGFDRNVTFRKIHKMTQGIGEKEQWKRRQLYGENAIHVDVQPYLKILFEEVLGPFYIFQLFSISVWFSDDYYYYATCIIIMSVMSLVSSVIQIRSNQEQLRDTVESVGYVKVCRGGDHYEEVPSSHLVPGDVVVVPTFNSVLQFDGILINGNVIVNESMLTGESVPVTKTPLPQNYSKDKNEVYYDEREHSKHTLFSGTKVMQTRYYGGVYVKALVIRVGFQTAKGELIRSIMFPKPVDFKFNKQIHKFIGVLACVATIGCLYSIVLKTQRGADLKTIIISALDLITILIPPALPAAMTVGIIYAQSRLKKNKIFCISPRSINISGCINCVCFDKTGTLTEDNLSFNEVVPLNPKKCCFSEPFDTEVLQTNLKQVEREHHLLLENGDFSPLMICLACCHSLTIIDQKIIGDPLDLQMFEATGWVLEEPDVDDENKFDLLAPTVVKPPNRKRRTLLSDEIYEASSECSSSNNSEEDLNAGNINRATRRCQRDVGILRQFPFSSSLQRMSVITRQFSGSQFIVYSKGAPEKIASLCNPKTIPNDFSEVLHGYTRNGFRVLALAYRPLKVGLSYAKMQRATRTDIERDLKFLGLLTLGNLLKPETIPAIEKLNKASIRTVMVTGDNMLTAISVAKECGMIASRDKTILIQVDKTKKDDSTSNDSPEANNNDTLALLPKADDYGRGISQAVILAVDNIQLHSKDESAPILGLATPKKPAKPKLTWHYVSSEQQETEGAYGSSGDVSLKMAFSDSKTHLALTGETWDTIVKFYPDLLDSICVRGTVFARMAPNQKQQLVEHLQSLQYYVGMCGDGANDSGALRSAHAGISLSDTEASVAAPFTSANPNISCVPILIAEGRAALVTAFGILKYMALYSLIQFCSVLLLYTLYTNFNDMQFMYEDLFIIAIAVALFGRTEPYPQLDGKAPSSSLLSVVQLSSVGIQLVLVVSFQVLSLIILWQNPWYEPHPKNYDEELASHDNFTIFVMSSFQCVSLAVVFSKGEPYRKSIVTNYLLTGALIMISLCTAVLTVLLAEWDIPYISLDVMNVPLEFRLIMLCLAATHFISAVIGERLIVDHIIFREGEKILELIGLGHKIAQHEKIDPLDMKLGVIQSSTAV